MNPERFTLLYADPPWRWESRTDAGRDRSPDRHYKTMHLDSLKNIPVKEWSAKNAMLALWTFDPMLPHALELAAAWGFRFSTVGFYWNKTLNGTPDMFGADRLNMGLGYHTRAGGTEQCWLFRRGRGLPRLRKGIRRTFFAPKGKHSAKPHCVADWLVDLYGDQPRIELFARDRKPGWRAWGDEV